MKELTLPAARENIPAVIDFVNRELKSVGCPMKTGEDGRVLVRLETEIRPRAVTISFIDEGRPFNPLEREDPDVSLSARERKIGGLGIFMVKKSMDDVRYEYRDGKNILTIRKTLP